MGKPLAGRRAFEAMGRSVQSRGLPITYGRASRLYWPIWAREAWAAGWVMQGNRRYVCAAAAESGGAKP